MPNAQKRKGSDWERQAVEILNANIKRGLFKRVPGSGAIGTFLNEPMLTSDIKGRVDSIDKELKIECKVGYGSATQFTMKKLWLDKVREESDASYGIPLLMGKFSGAREGIKAFVVMDIDTFCELVNRLTEVWEEGIGEQDE
jgi:hypothetical protein